MFTNSSKIMEKMVNMQKSSRDKTRLGFYSISSLSQTNLTNQTTSLINKGLNAKKLLKVKRTLSYQV